MLPFIKKHCVYIIIILLSLVFLTNHLSVALRPPASLMKWFTNDDAYYYFQVARNVAEGKGFTFDGIGRSNGFHPVWMLINIPIFALARVNLYLPFRILVLVSTMITLLGGLILFDLLKRFMHVEAAVLGLAIWIFFRPIQWIITYTSMEAGISAFSILLFLWLMYKLDRSRPSHYLILGFSAAFVLFSRLDNIFFILLAGVALVFDRVPMRNLMIIDILIIFISVFSSIVIRVGAFDSLGFLSSTKLFFLVAVAVRLIAFYLMGLFQWPKSYSLIALIGRIIAALTIGSLVITLVMLSLIQLNLVVNFPRSAMLIETGLTLLLLLISRFSIWIVKSPNLITDLRYKTNSRHWLSRGVVYLLPIALFLCFYFMWNLFSFGTIMPISGQIKEWWGTLLTMYGRCQKNLGTMMGLIPLTKEDQQPWFLIHQYLYQPFITLFNIDRMDQIPSYLSLKVVLTLIYGVLTTLILSKRLGGIHQILLGVGFLPLLAASLIQPLYYGFTGYIATRSWYWVPQIITTILFFLILMDSIIDCVKQKGHPIIHFASLAYVLALILMLHGTVRTHRYFPFHPTQADVNSYLAVPRFLEENTPPDSKIGIAGGGTVAYFIQDRIIINLDGLINSKAYYDLMRAGQAHQYLDEIGLDYVLGSSIVFYETDPYHWCFVNRLKKIDHFGEMEFFQYLPGR